MLVICYLVKHLRLARDKRQEELMRVEERGGEKVRKKREREYFLLKSVMFTMFVGEHTARLHSYRRAKKVI